MSDGIDTSDQSDASKKSTGERRSRLGSLLNVFNQSTRQNRDLSVSDSKPWYYESHEAVTLDDWRLSLKHYPAFTTENQGATQSVPLLLIHGLSANHRVFDLRGERSLAWALCEKGYNVWLLDLRGSGKSEKVKGKKKAINWDMRAYAEDAKIGIDYVLKHHSATHIHLGGHSMGGILGLMLLSAYPEYAARIRSLFTLASSIHYHDSAWKNLSPMLPLAEFIDFLDLQTLMKLYAPFVIWPSFVAHITNVKKSDLRKVLFNVEKVPTKALKDLATAFGEEGMMIDFEDGKGPQFLSKLLPRVTQPVLCFAADFDKQCSVPSVRRTLKALGSSRKHLVVVGPKPKHTHHYGHVDIMIGSNTQTEVFPYVTEFLLSVDNECYVPSFTLGSDISVTPIQEGDEVDDSGPPPTPQTQEKWEMEAREEEEGEGREGEEEGEEGGEEGRVVDEPLSPEEIEEEADRVMEYRRLKGLVDGNAREGNGLAVGASGERTKEEEEQQQQQHQMKEIVIEEKNR